MFCQHYFITNKIFAFLNASVGWIKKNRCYGNNFNLKVASATKPFFCHKVALDVQLINIFI